MLLELAEGKPVVVTRFPAAIKPFYMAKHEGTFGDVAECFDLLMPVGGEVVGGSMRETDHAKLSEAVHLSGIQGLQW